MKIILPPKVKYIIDEICANGYEAYIVGGCVRDSLIGIKPNDFDITTSATPDNIMSIFSKFECIKIGIKHGTVGVIIDKEIFEITTYRIESKYKDHRRPDTIEFTSNLHEDLKRRDFTINAMAYNEKNNLVDIFGGKLDIENKIIRTVGNPNERFYEDGLRMIRAIRFSSKLNFHIEENTLKAVYDNAHIIKSISLERITDEFTKIILSDNPQNLIYLFKTKIINYLGICNDICEDKLDELGEKLRLLKSIEKDLLKRLIILDYYINFAGIDCDIIGSKLIFPKKISKVEKIILECIDKIDIKILNKIEIKKILNEIGLDVFNTYLDVCCVIYNKNKYVQNIIDILSEIEENNECYMIKNLDIKGNDIIYLGYKDEKIGQILNHLLEEVIKNPLLNKKEILVKIIKETY